MKFDTKLVRIGTSLAPIIPQEFRKKWNLSEKDEVIVEIWKRGNLKEIFGKLKDIDAEELSKIADENGWDE